MCLSGGAQQAAVMRDVARRQSRMKDGQAQRPCDGASIAGTFRLGSHARCAHLQLLGCDRGEMLHEAAHTRQWLCIIWHAFNKIPSTACSRVPIG
jgi:hypothetical protein